MSPSRRNSSRGGIFIMTLTLVMMFVVMFVALTGFVTRSYHEASIQIQNEVAFHIAEAGLNFGRWRLAQAVDDFSSETREVRDPQGDVLGSYEVTFTIPPEGGNTVMIESRGVTSNLPTREVTLRVRYGRPSLARYVSITNSDSWYRGTINGPVHSNGGIRMDGDSESIITSARETYMCKQNSGCGPPPQQRPGVWGSGTTQDLWQFPVPEVDYGSLSLDLLSIKEVAQGMGTYYGPSGVGFVGYEIVFNDGNTYSIYRVTQKAPDVRSRGVGESSCKWDSHDVGSRESLPIEVKQVPSDGVIYVEDTLWMRGDIRDRVTVAAGKFPDTPSSNVDIILNGSLSYGGVKDGTRSLGVIAQRNILLPWSGALGSVGLDGAFVAQQGYFGRRYYGSACGSSGEDHNMKTSLTRYGMVASNLEPVTAWVDGGQVTSGYQAGSTTYDPNFLYNPPPFFPMAGEYEFISWEEVN